MNHDKKCFIEGIFFMPENEGIKSFLKENNLDGENELVLREKLLQMANRALLSMTRLLHCNN